MATTFPTSVDNFTNPASNDSLNSPSHSTQHANANDAIEAIETYVLGTQSSFRNVIINGDFRINQRAFSSTTTSGNYGFDRWLISSSGGTATYSAQAFTTGNAISGYEPINYARVVTASQSGIGDYAIFAQKIEDVRTFAGQTITISFWAKASTGTPKVSVEFSQIFGTGGSSSVDTYIGQSTLSTTWTRFSLTTTVPSISGKTIGTGSSLNLNFWTSAGSNYNSRTGSLGIQNATIDIWGVQVEAGSGATAFEVRPIQTELALCQRYYWRVTADSSNTYAKFGSSAVPNTATAGIASLNHPVTMRTSATSIDYSNIAFMNYGTTNYAISSAAISLNSQSTVLGLISFVSTGMTSGQPGWLESNNSASGYIGFSAEL